MLNLKLTFSNIEYEKTFSALLPLLMEKINGMDGGSLPVRLLQKVGERSEKAVLGMMNRLSGERKNDVVMFVFRNYKERFLGMLKGFLQEKCGGSLSFEDAFIVAGENGQLCLYLKDVTIDYYEMAKLVERLYGAEDGRTAAAKGAGRLMNFLGADGLILHFLGKEKNMKFIIDMLERVLVACGIHVKVADCEVMRSSHPIPSDVIEQDANTRMPQALTEELTDAIAGYIVELIDGYGTALPEDA